MRKMDPAHDHDRRLESRHTSVLRLALLVASGEAQLCRVSNISPLGVQVTVFRRVNTGASAILRIPDGITLAGTVVWADSCRIGLKLDQPVPAAQLLRLRHQSAVLARRRLPRICVGVPGWLKSGVRRHRVEMLDISPAGALVFADQQLPGLGPVELHVAGLPRIRCQIRWVQDSRAGLLFNEPIQLQLLSAWLEQHCDPALCSPGDQPGTEPAPRRDPPPQSLPCLGA